MSVYKRAGSPYYQFEFKLNGRKVRGSTGETSKREARAVERQEKSKAKKAARSVVCVKGAPTVDQVFARYFESHAKKLGWADAVLDHLNEALEILGEATLFKDIKGADVAEVLDDYAQTGVADSTVNRRLAVLRGVHNMARDVWELDVSTIVWKKHTREEAQARVRHITLETAKKLLAHLPEHIQLMFGWSLATGCRLGETVSLRWDRINLETMQVEVKTKSRKKNATRFINLNDEALEILSRCDTSGTHVFDATNRRRHWAAAKAAVELEDFTWHDLRHTFATWLGQSGASLQVVQQALGHSQVGTTMKYLHVIRADVAKAVQQMPRVTAQTIIDHTRKLHNLGPPQKYPQSVPEERKSL